ACRLWDTATGEQTVCITYQHAGATLSIKSARFFAAPLAGAPPLLVTAMAAPRGPACLGIYATDGTLVKEAKVDAKPLTCMSVSDDGKQLCLNLVTGAKRIYALPSLKCIKKVENVHELPAPCAAFLGEATVVSGSGDRSINLMFFGKGKGGILRSDVEVFCVMLAMIIVAFFILRIGLKGGELQQGLAANRLAEL
ncbi:unnamed protein product, partial [Polarella glacialis]